MGTLSHKSFLDQALSIQWPVTPRTLAFSIRLEDERDERVGRDFLNQAGKWSLSRTQVHGYIYWVGTKMVTSMITFRYAKNVMP